MREGGYAMKQEKAYYHLPGSFEFYELYRKFLPLFRTYARNRCSHWVPATV